MNKNDITVKESDSINFTPEPNTIVFHAIHEGKEQEILKISLDGFFYKGERVDDINDIYTRFSEWITLAEFNKE